MRDPTPNFGTLTISGDKVMSELDKRRQADRKQMFLANLEASGWDSKTAIAQAVKAGVFNDPEVLALLQQKKTEENQGDVDLVLGRAPVSPDAEITGAPIALNTGAAPFGEAGPSEPVMPATQENAMRRVRSRSAMALSTDPWFVALPKNQQAIEADTLELKNKRLAGARYEADTRLANTQADAAGRKYRQDVAGITDPVDVYKAVSKNFELSMEDERKAEEAAIAAETAYAKALEEFKNAQYTNDDLKRIANQNLNGLKQKAKDANDRHKMAKQLKDIDRKHIERAQSRMPGFSGGTSRQAEPPKAEVIDEDIKNRARDIVSAAPPLGGSTDPSIKSSQSQAIASTVQQSIAEMGVNVPLEKVMEALAAGESKNADLNQVVAEMLMAARVAKRKMTENATANVPRSGQVFGPSRQAAGRQ